MNMLNICLERVVILRLDVSKHFSPQQKQKSCMVIVTIL